MQVIVLKKTPGAILLEFRRSSMTKKSIKKSNSEYLCSLICSGIHYALKYSDLTLQPVNKLFIVLSIFPISFIIFLSSIGFYSPLLTY